MPVEQVPGTALHYYMVSYDPVGRERRDDPGGRMGQRVIDALGDESVTDVFLLSHGWQGDVPAARAQYSKWIAAMDACRADVDRMRERRPRFRPLLVCLHWPSRPWGDEELAAASGAFDAVPLPSVEDLIARYAEQVADTPAARDALGVIFAAAERDIAPESLPADVRTAYEVLDRESQLRHDGAGGAPGDDREPFDPDRVYAAALDEAVSFGDMSLGGLLAPLGTLSFWKMKARACLLGETGAAAELFGWLLKVGAARPDVRFHLMGHSFGCIVVSALLAGRPGRDPLPRPVDSVVLVQGALSIWSFCARIPYQSSRAGYFHRVVSEKCVAGPILATLSEHDTALSRFYPMGAGLRRQIAYSTPDEFPRYGALGTYGARGPDLPVSDEQLQPVSVPYRFESGRVYNIESSQYICEGKGASGAHSDIAKPEVAHAVWGAALASS